MITKRIINKLRQVKYYKELKKNKVDVFSKADIDKETVFEGYNRVIGNSSIRSSYLGVGTYIGDGGIIKKTKIGRFCSIGSNVRILDGTHPTKIFVSTHPAFFRGEPFCGLTFSKDNLFQEHIFTDDKKNWLCEIGNDVWIGDSVLILNGIKIGDGAIVAAGAVVVKDVPPYAIVGGIPAKVIKYRFTEEQIKWLLYFRWWDKDLTWIKENAQSFENINLMMKQFMDLKT